VKEGTTERRKVKEGSKGRKEGNNITGLYQGRKEGRKEGTKDGKKDGTKEGREMKEER
jgi:hypothetical protein